MTPLVTQPWLSMGIMVVFLCLFASILLVIEQYATHTRRFSGGGVHARRIRRNDHRLVHH
jgi:hypothetical protein